ncbi:MAG: hypothetical protein K6C14_06925 [Eubacterium sp.]|nr:hypothetical protein [Eubacterium sp.]
MTSLKYSADKKAASYDLRRAFKQGLIPAVFSLLMSALTFLGSAWSALDTIKEELENAPATFTAVRLAPQWVGCSLVCLLIGVIFAMTNFYIMNKPSVNFHLALSVDRKTLFKNRFIASTVLIAAVFGTVFLIDFAANASVLGNTAFIFKIALSLFLESFIYAMAGYVIVSIAVFSCYTVIEGLFFGAALLALPGVLITAYEVLCNCFLNGYSRVDDFFDIMFWGESYFGNLSKPSLLIALAVANPLLLGFIESADGIKCLYNFGYQGYTSVTDGDYGPNYDYLESAVLPDIRYYIPLIVWAVLIVLLALFAQRLFINRKAEKTAIHGSNPLAYHIFATELGIGAAFITVYFFVELSEVKFSVPLAIFLYCFAFAAATLVTLAICKRQVIFKNKKAYLVPACSTVCFALLIVILVTGGFGYTSYAPKADDIELAVITNTDLGDMTGRNLTSDEDYYPQFGFAKNCLTVIDGKEDINTLLAEKDKIVKNPDRSTSAQRVSIVYVTKSGKRVLREYAVKADTAVASAQTIMNTDSYKNTVKSIITCENVSGVQKKLEKTGLNAGDFINDDMVVSGNDGLNGLSEKVFKNGIALLEHFGNEETVKLKNTPELKNAIALDLVSNPVEKRLFPEEKELCRITFTDGMPQEPEYNEYGEEIYYDSYSGYTYIVYPYMENTVSYLKGKGYLKKDVPLFNTTPELAYISKVNAYTHTPYASPYSGGVTLFSAYDGFNTENGWIGENGEYKVDSYLFDDIGEVFEKKIEDKAEIEKLMNSASTYGLLNNDDYIAAFKIKAADGGETYRFMCVKNPN